MCQINIINKNTNVLETGILRMIGTIVLILVIVLTAGCGGKASNENGSQSQQGEESRTNTEKAYVVCGTNHINEEYDVTYGVFTASGKELLPLEKETVSIVTDVLTGEQVMIQRNVLVGAEEIPGDYWTDVVGDYEYRWYDMDGNQLDNPNNTVIIGKAGEIWIESTNDEICIRNHATGEVISSDSYWFNIINDKVLINTDNLVKAYEADGTLAWEQQGNLGYARGNYGTLNLPNGLGCVLIDADGNRVLPDVFSEIRLENKNGIVTAEDETGSRVYNLNKSKEPIFVMAETGMNRSENSYNTFIATADETGAVISRPSGDSFGNVSQRFLYDGTAVGGEYNLITTSDTLEGYYLGYKYNFYGDTVVELFDANGKVVLTAMPYDTQQISETRLIANRAVIDMDGNRITQKDYYYIYPLYGKTDTGLLTAAYFYNNAILTDLLDYNGNMVVERLRSVAYLGDHLLWVEKGFFMGMMDDEGNWIYKTGLFRQVEES